MNADGRRVSWPRRLRGDQHPRKVAMQAHTTWLSEAEKSAIVDEAVELLGRVGMRYAGSAVLPLLEERGAQRGPRHRHRPPSPRAGRVGGRPVPAEHPDGRPHRGRRRAAGRGRALPLRAQRLRRQDARLPHRQAPRQHAAGPARVHGAHGRAAATRHHVDAGQRVRRAARSSASSPSTSRCSPRPPST